MKKLKFLLLVFLLALETHAQRTLNGIVIGDSDNEPIIGATITTAMGTGCITDIDGKFSIELPNGKNSIKVSYIGYKTQTVDVTNKNQIKVILHEEAESLNEVVVVGYGTMKRSDLTGSVASIDEKAIKEGVVTSLEQTMQGRIAGVQVTQNSGAPGGGISVQIRGVSSFNGNEPLYVIDGIAQSGDSNSGTSSLSSINPSDITRIEVLKDASATAIYGSRASNGVVIISTKHGQEGRTKIQYEGSLGWQSMPKYIKMLSLPEYAEFINERALIQGYGYREEYSHPELLTQGTDWQRELFQSAFMHSHSLNINGGNKDMHYSISGGYLDQDGISLGSGFDRLSLRTNFDVNATDWLQIGTNVYFAITEQDNTFSSGSAISTAFNQFPDVSPYNPDGTLGFPEENTFGTYYSNPIYEATMRENKEKNHNADFNLFANIKPIKGLNIRVEYGGSIGWYGNYYYQPGYTYGNVVMRSESRRTKNKSTYNNFKQYATYEFEPIRDNHITMMVGHEAQWGSWESLSGTRYDFISNNNHSLNVGNISTSTNSGSDPSKWSIESYFGRLNYNFHDRYLLTATFRADGSSSFAKNNRWGFFPSFAAAWRIKNEKFMENVSWITNMKLRVGWGLVGNQNSSSYAYGSTMANIATAWGTGYYPANFSNSSLKWESTRAWNVGLDLAFLNNRIEFIADWYYKDTRDLLMQAALPSYVINNDYMGMSSPWVNAGSIRNTGVEFTLNTVNITNKNWEWRTAATFSINRNKLTSLNSESSAITGTYGSDTFTMTEVGGAIGRFYGYNVIGMFTCEDDFYRKNSDGEFLVGADGNRIPVARPVDTNGDFQPISKSGIWVGDYIYEDVDKDGKITEADRKYIGNPNPSFTFGLNNTLRWKCIELNAFFNGSVGNDVYNYVKQRHTDTAGYGNKMGIVADFARIGLIDPLGTDNNISNVYVTNAGTARVARINAAGSSLNDNNRVSNLYVEDASYLRLKSLTVAWNIPEKWVKPIKLEYVQLYFNATNLFTITGYDGYDPEVGVQSSSVIMQGWDNYRYPSPRVYTIGMRARF